MGVFENSVSGMLAFRKALGTTSHNISNVNTEGFSRQRAELATRTPQGTGSGFTGSGVETQTVRRIFDQTRETAVQRNTSEFEQLDTLARNAGRIDDLVADDSAGIAPALQDFYGAVQDVASDPSSGTSRQTLLTQAENLASRFRTLGTQLREFSETVDDQLNVKVEEVNQLARSIAELNQDIARERGRFDQPPNDLLDQRDQLVRELSTLVDTRTTENNDGSINVLVGTGQSLVAGLSSTELTTEPDPLNPQRLNVAITDRQGGTTDISRQISGGQIGGLLTHRGEVLDPARSDLNDLGQRLTEVFNEQHRQGLQFSAGGNGALGGDLFSTPQARVTSDGVDVDPGFASGGALDSVQLTFDDSSGEWTAENLETGDTRTPFTDSNQTVNFAGFSLDMGQVDNSPTDGARILVDPNASAATGMRVAINSADEVAAASPMRVSAATNNQGQATNTGDARVTDFQVEDIDSGFDLDDLNFDLQFDGGNNRFDIQNFNGDVSRLDASGNPVAGPSGKQIDFSSPPQDVTLRITDTASPANTAEVAFTLSGDPDDGDSFNFERNTNATGDNANAVAMGELAQQEVFADGSNLQEFYGGLVGEVGTRTLQAQTSRDAQETVLEQSKAARNEISGVNLDEEAANLIQFQQAFQASAQAISIARTTFDSLLAATRG